MLRKERMLVYFLNRNLKRTLHIMYWFRSLSWGPFVYACLIDFHLKLSTLNIIKLPDVETKRKTNIFHQEDFKTFDYVKNRLDEFYGQYLDRNIKYTDLWHVMKFVFVLPHGQARVERGFNINDDISVVNLSKESLIAQRIIYDHMKINDLKAHNIVISAVLQKSCMLASQKRREHLEKQKKEKERNIPDKNDHLRQELQEHKRKMILMKTSVDNLEKEYKVCLEKASSQTNTNKMKELVDRGAAMLKSANEKRAGMELIQNEINTINYKLYNK